MLSDDIRSVYRALGQVLPRVDVDSAAMIRACRSNLDAAVATATQLENSLLVEPTLVVSAISTQEGA